MITRVTDIEAPDTTVSGETPTWQPEDAAPGAPPATTATAVDNPLPGDRYLNRELSWLDFNARVLALGRGHLAAVAGAGEVPGDLRFEPG